VRRIVVNDHFDLIHDYPLMGIPPQPPQPRIASRLCGAASCSCHTLAEVSQWKPEMDYVFLSPIFDSISKSGYHSAFTLEVLQQAAAHNIIDEKVVALGE
jgi:thiamine-phosphate pyrophosphorylase